MPRGDEGYADIGQLWHKFWIFTDGEKDVTKLEAKARALLWGCEHLEITKASDGSAFELDEYEIVPEFITASCSRVNGDQSREFHLYNPGDQEVTAQIFCNGKIAASQKLMPRAFKKVIF